MVRAATALLLLLVQDDLEKRRDALVPKLEELRGLKFKSPLAIREGTRRDYAALSRFHYRAGVWRYFFVFEKLVPDPF